VLAEASSLDQVVVCAVSLATARKWYVVPSWSPVTMKLAPGSVFPFDAPPVLQLEPYAVVVPHSSVHVKSVSGANDRSTATAWNAAGET
jgi:hypothetical protein